jgi:hypothetical protein
LKSLNKFEAMEELGGHAHSFQHKNVA